MRLRAVIIDDEETGIDILKLLIEKHVKDVNVVATATRAKEGIALIENYLPEIVFLDISMPEMDGFELIDKLTWKNFQLVFITAHQQHALKALKLQATDYLLKPVDHSDLCSAVNRVRERIAGQNENHAPDAGYSLLNSINVYYASKLAVTSKQGVEYVDPQEILYLESRSNYTILQLNNQQSIITPRTLREFELQLCNDLNFMRVHHSFVVNLRRITRFIKERDSIIMSNNHKIPLSKSRRSPFIHWLRA